MHHYMKRKARSDAILTGMLILLTTVLIQSGSAAPPSETNNSKILVEIFLSKEHKSDLDAIKKEFGAFGITKIKAQFFKLGNPPENIAIGRNVPAGVARLTIQLAITYNRGINFLLPEERLAADYLAIGTSIFDESFQRPITPEQLKQLSDPSLTTEQFHALYRHITKEDQRQP